MECSLESWKASVLSISGYATVAVREEKRVEVTVLIVEHRMVKEWETEE